MQFSLAHYSLMGCELKFLHHVYTLMSVIVTPNHRSWRLSNETYREWNVNHSSRCFFSSPRCLERVHIYNFIIPDEYLHDKQPPVIKRKNCTTPQSETKCKFTSAFTENFFFNFAFFFYQQRCVCSRYLALHNSSCRGRRGRQKGVRQSIKTSSEREKI